MRHLLFGVALLGLSSSMALGYCPQPGPTISQHDPLVDEINYLVCLNNEQADAISLLQRQVDDAGGLIDATNAAAETLVSVAHRVDDLEARIAALESARR